MEDYMAEQNLQVRVVLSPDTEALLDAFERGWAAIAAAGLEERTEVLACVADIQHRGCMPCVFDASCADGVVTVWLADNVLLGHFAKFQGYAQIAMQYNRERHNGKDRSV